MKSFKKMLLAAAVMFSAAVVASAVPALPGKFKYTQPDGTVIELIHHGDEFFHWVTRASDGAVMERGADGFYRPGSISVARREAGRRKSLQVNERRLAKGIRTHNNDPMTHGQRHIPVLLVQFQDLAFSIDQPEASFERLLNQSGYSDNGATGSVRDFYYDNSGGAFEPIFDVYGPVTLSKEMSYYGQNNDAGNDMGYAAFAVAEAAKLLDSQIDFSTYDYDKDGEVDMMLMYYAGYNEAEYGPDESIWPHQWYVDALTNVSLDGKHLSRYFCTSELRNNSGTEMCGIGTTCHEFGHSLGLPDFYDIDYAKNGESGAVYSFSTMCSGSYNNSSRTPPYFNSEERIILGWLTEEDVPELPDGSVTLKSVKDDYAYRSYTGTEGEYFLYEYRDGSGWDAPLPKGMVVYHVDKSKYRMVGDVTPYDRWESWNINNYGDHPCYYVVPAYDQASLNFAGGLSYMVFPGAGTVKSFSPVDWEDSPTGTNLTGITVGSSGVTFTVNTVLTKTLGGYVKDSSGAGIADAVVTVSKPAQAQVRVPFRPAPSSSETLSATTGEDGSFSIDLSSFEGSTAHVSVYKTGYAMVSKDVSLSDRGARIVVSLYPEVDGSDVWIQYYDEDADTYAFGSASVMCAIKIPADELSRFAGWKIDKVNTALNCTSASEVYVFAEAGGVRLLNHKVSSPSFKKYFDVDMGSDGLTVPEGKDLYIGIAVKGADYQYPLIISAGKGNCYYADYSLSGNTAWSQFGGYDFEFSVHIAADDSSWEDKYQKLADAGYNVIYPGDSFTHSAGEQFQLRLYEASGVNKPSSVEWLYDGSAVSGTSVTLTKGSHEVTARLVLADGRKEVLDLELSVQ